MNGMDAAGTAPNSWSRRQWTGVGCLLLLLHVLLIAVLSPPPGEPPRRPAPFEPVVRLIPPGPAGRAALEAGGDPTLFALTSAHGFSGRAWTGFDFFEHELGDWREAPRWLAPLTGALGGAFVRFAPSAGTNLPGFQEGAPARMPLASYRPLPLHSATTLRVEGDLATRPLLDGVDLPPWPHPDLLGSSVVQVAVNPAGDVVSARLLSGSGSTAADQRALELAHALRFAPARPGEGHAVLVWGTLSFRWAVTEPTAPASPAAPAVPVTP